MGLHICIVDKDYKENPDWDFIRQGDDRKNVSLLNADHESWHSGRPFWEDDYFLMRPTPTTKLVGYRGEEMMRILEDPQWWVYVSY